MDASKYLPPFAQGQRGDATADQPDGTPTAGVASRSGDRRMVDAGSVEHEATYADFLGDQVDD